MFTPLGTRRRVFFDLSFVLLPVVSPADRSRLERRPDDSQRWRRRPPSPSPSFGRGIVSARGDDRAKVADDQEPDVRNFAPTRVRAAPCLQERSFWRRPRHGRVALAWTIVIAATCDASLARSSSATLRSLLHRHGNLPVVRGEPRGRPRVDDLHARLDRALDRLAAGAPEPPAPAAGTLASQESPGSHPGELRTRSPSADDLHAGAPDLERRLRWCATTELSRGVEGSVGPLVRPSSPPAAKHLGPANRRVPRPPCERRPPRADPGTLASGLHLTPSVGAVRSSPEGSLHNWAGCPVFFEDTRGVFHRSHSGDAWPNR